MLSPYRISSSLFCWLSVDALQIAGCGDDASGDTDAGTVDGASPDAGPGPAGFIVCGITVTPDGLTGFAGLTASLAAGSDVDLSRALELGGGISCANQGRTLYVAGGETAQVTRYTIGADASFTEDGTISFAGVGVDAGGSIALLSETKAYYVDGAMLTVVVWNPSTLLIEGELSLEGLATPEGEGIGIIVEERAGRVVLVAAYGDAVNGNNQRLRVALIDPATDAVTVDETRSCGGSFTSADGGDGFLYLGAGVRPAVSFRLGLPETYAPCLVRVDVTTGEFDDGFLRDLNELTGVNPTGIVSPGPTPGTLLLTGYDESVLPNEDGAADNEVQLAESWRTYLLEDLGGSAPATLLDNLPVVTGVTRILTVNDRIYFGFASPGFATSSLVDITDPDAPADAAVLSGGVLQILSY